jgi:hypothetical protein
MQHRKWFCWLSVFFLVMSCGLGPQASQSDAKAPGSRGGGGPIRFFFDIDPETPLKDLLPAAPDVLPTTPPWLVRDLTDVPEIHFQRAAPPLPSLTKAMEETAHCIAKINHVNKAGDDHFLQVLVENRRDLSGLPFIKGKDCRQSPARAHAFFLGVNWVNRAMPDVEFERQKPPSQAKEATGFWDEYRRGISHDLQKDRSLEKTERVAALMQMLAPLDLKMRMGLVRHLASIYHSEATRALAQIAVFSLEKELRQAALAALANRPTDDYTDILLAGIRYPWPAVAENAGAAIASLRLKQLVPTLTALLKEPDPRSPHEESIDGQKTLVVREVVRVNHLRNCLLCHPPATGGNSAVVVTGAVPSPGHRFPAPSGGYDRETSPDLVVRADVTYLRQDFSLMHRVKNANPWPEVQRYDYLVRTRVVGPKESAAYANWARRHGRSYLAPHQRAVYIALGVSTEFVSLGSVAMQLLASIVPVILLGLILVASGKITNPFRRRDHRPAHALAAIRTELADQAFEDWLATMGQGKQARSAGAKRKQIIPSLTPRKSPGRCPRPAAASPESAREAGAAAGQSRRRSGSATPAADRGPRRRT